jgi:predicted ATPase/DNA-binding NarL/FixJ family response regulator
MSDDISAPVTQSSPILLALPEAPGGSTLPDTPGPLIGREREIETLLSLLHTPEMRLLTLTGVGGTGKTRLALEVAARTRHRYAHGAAFVALAPISDPAHVAPAIARALGVRELADAPLMELLVAALVERELLLLIDNVEHVLEAAPAIADLVVACPRLTILATSRAPLRLALEREVRVPPLELPHRVAVQLPGDVDRAASVRFFVEQAKTVVPGFALTSSNADVVAAICRRLDGLPLAIKLAAGRSRVLEPAALLTRLEHRLPLLTGGQRDTPARHRTMRDAITWSYDLLREHEQVLFRRLSVFAGGWTLETVEAMTRELAQLHHDQHVPADVLPETPVLILDVLETLIDHHLIEREEQPSGDIRLSMLETIREFALEQLEVSGESDIVRTAHAAAITAWAERAKPLMLEADQARWLARGAAEQPNVRAALEWILERGDATNAHRLAAANGPVWLKQAMLREAQGWLERVLALPGSAPAEAVTVCRFIASSIAQALGSNELALQHSRVGLALARDAGDRLGEGLALTMQSSVLLDSELDAADQANEAALACFWSLSARPQIIAVCLLQRGVIARSRGNYVQFAELAKEAYDYSLDIQDSWSIAAALIVRAEAAYLNRDLPQTLAHLADGIAIAHHIESIEIQAWATQIGALVAHTSGDHRWAAAGSAAQASIGVRSGGTLAEQVRVVMADAKKAIGQKAAKIEEAAAYVLPLTTAVDEVRAYRPGERTPQATSPLGLARLTSREEAVLRLIASGLTDLQIAEALFIARPTVSKHVSNILSKLDVTSRTAAVDTAHRLGLIEGAP